MAGGRKPLSAAQRVAVTLVKDSRVALRTARDTIEERQRVEREKEMGALEMNYALSIRQAREMGVPLTTIGVEGMNTSDPHTVRRWLKKTERMTAQYAAIGAALNVFSWEDREAGVVNVKFHGFPTTAVEPEDYPEALEGVVKIDAKSRNGWAVVTDPGNIEHELGTLPGWLTWEIIEVPKEKPGSLVQLLDEWVEENR